MTNHDKGVTANGDPLSSDNHAIATHVSAPEHLEVLTHVHTNIDVIETTTANPYLELNFIGTYLAIAFAAAGAFSGFSMPATSLSIINEQIGASSNITWVALAWTLTSSIGFTLVGRLSDVFGRRYFFMGCSALAAIGCIVGATAQSVNQLIGAAVLLGFGAAGQISFNYTLGELVPIRHRFAANGFIFLFTTPTTALGPYVARLFIANTGPSWRSIYYFGLAVNLTATLLWLIFYHPPQFEDLHRSRTRMQELGDIDCGGIVLFTDGALIFLLGLSWGGGVYSWKSAHVLATLIPGFFVLIAFILYDTYMPLRRPLIPMGLFRNFDYVIWNILSIVGGTVYYSAADMWIAELLSPTRFLYPAVIWPIMVGALHTTDIVKGGLLSCAVVGGVCAGQFFGAWLAVPGGHLKLKMILATMGLTAFTAGLAAATDNQAVGSALAVCAGLMVGTLEVCVSTAVTIVLDDQSEMGTAAGVFGSLRGAGGVLATAIYVSILNNKIASNTATFTVPAIVQAGLPTTSVEQFLAALATGNEATIEAVTGVSEAIITAATEATRKMYAQSFKVVWLATLAFGILSIIAACFAHDIDHLLSHDVIRRLDKKDDEESEPTEKEHEGSEHREEVV